MIARETVIPESHEFYGEDEGEKREKIRRRTRDLSTESFPAAASSSFCKMRDIN